ncbi:phosphotransferase family protein [Kiloniella sp.]|uniref:phosphotransferase family protein n=1 Tax=Kiloniella sp. TaxID=1938587 RepID=UPI003B022043
MEQIFPDSVNVDALADFVGHVLGRQGLVIDKMITMSGGAIQENWRLDYHEFSGEEGSLVVRADAHTGVPGSHPKEDEFEVLSYAWKAGVKAPKPLALCLDKALIGRSFILMELLPGTTDFDQIKSSGNCEALAYELGSEIAQLHQLCPTELKFLNKASPNPVEELINRYRGFCDGRNKPNPVAEWAMRWCLLQQTKLPPLPQVLVHGDFRTANYLVTPEGLSGLLDWEFSGWGDPYSDLGWFCAKCWRYGHEDNPAGGIASRKSFYEGYSAITGKEVDHQRVLFWEVMSLLRWLVIAIQQGDRNFVEGERDLELGLTGLIRPPEIEMMLLEMTAPDNWPESQKDPQPDTRPDLGNENGPK